jgi:hypothetical protein
VIHSTEVETEGNEQAHQWVRGKQIIGKGAREGRKEEGIRSLFEKGQAVQKHGANTGWKRGTIIRGGRGRCGFFEHLCDYPKAVGGKKDRERECKVLV